MRKLCLLVGILLWVYSARAQNPEISGKVSDEKGLPIPGVTVQIKGTRKATVTNFDGKFTIPVKKGTTLIFSAVGYDSKEVVANDAVITVSLKIGNQLMNEVVVTGVGAARDKRTVGIDLATLSSKDVAKSATASVEQALQGKIAGAQILINSGSPGSGADILLRSYTNLSSSYPLILVDGIQVYDLYSLDLSNIERVEVVKGAAGGTLYGAQGGNGVIQIFTKKGSKNGGKPSISVSTKYTFDNIIKGDRSLVNAFHHYQTNAAGYIIDNNGIPVAPDSTGLWPQPQFVTLDTSTQNNKPFKEPVYDHMKQAYDQAFSSNTNLNISGGGDKFDYAFAGSFFKQKSTVRNFFDRTNLSMNFGVDLARGLTLRNISQVILQNEDLLGGSRFDMIESENYFDFTKRYNGFLPVTLIKEAGQRNPLSEFDWHQRNSKTNRIVQNFDLNYKFPRFVELDYKYGVDIWNTESFDYYKNQQTAPQYLAYGYYWGPSGKGSVYNDYNRSTYQNSLASLFFKTDFQTDFNLNIPVTTVTQVAYDWRKDKRHFFWIQGTGLAAFAPVSIANTDSRTGSESASEFVTYGVMVNQMIDWGKLAGAGYTLRSDYSSAFGQGGKPFTFPRGNIYFRPSELIKSNIVSEVKLRAAYGKAGVQPGAYQRQTTISSANYASTGVYLTLPGTLNNPSLQVQVTDELEIGTDIGVTPGFSGTWLKKIGLTFNYWKRNSQNVIDLASSALSSGANAEVDNVVDLKSKGMELQLDAAMFQSRNFTWNFGYRFSNPKTLVTRTFAHQPEISTSNSAYALREGENIGVLWGQYALTSTDAKAADGTAYIADADKKYYSTTSYGNIIDTRTGTAVLSSSNDKRKIGDPNPKFVMNFINNFTILKNFTFSFQVDWFYGNKLYNQTRQWLYRDRRSKDFDIPFSYAGKTGAYVTYYNSMYNSVEPTDWFVEDGSFLRLRDLSLSYSATRIPGLQGIVKGMTVTLAARNLWTKTNYHGLDPEAVTTGAYGRGFDSFTFPTLKSVQVGVNLMF